MPTAREYNGPKLRSALAALHRFSGSSTSMLCRSSVRACRSWFGFGFGFGFGLERVRVRLSEGVPLLRAAAGRNRVGAERGHGCGELWAR